MNILLVFPKNPESMVFMDSIVAPEPLALEYVGAGVSKQHNVRILDMRFEDDDFQTVIREFKPDIVGFTAFTFHLNGFKQLCQDVKTINNGIVTVIGGTHASLVPQDFDESFIDIIVIGEGVFTFKNIVDRKEKGLPISDVKGIAWQNNGRLCFNEPAGYPDLDEYPFPDRSLADHVRDKHYKVALLVTSKGCPYHCNFCCCWKLSQRKYLTRKPESIVAELQRIKEPVVHFADDESFIDIERMERLADLIIEAKINKKFICYVRADTTVKHPELLRKWQKAGLTYAFIGVEAFSNKYLKMYQKANDTAINEQAVALLKEFGIGLMASFIIRPDFDHEDFVTLAEYARKLKPEKTFFSVLTPFPGTDLYEETKDQFITNNYDLFDMWHTILPTKLPLRQFFEEITKLYIKTAEMGTTIFGSLKEAKPETDSGPKITNNAVDLQRFERKVSNLYQHYACACHGDGSRRGQSEVLRAQKPN